MMVRLDDTIKAIIDDVLYPLWDLGLQLGYAIRTIDETLVMAKDDHTIMTNLLDARHVVGHKPLSAQLLKRYDAELRQQRVTSFIKDKLDELAVRHKAHGDSRFLLEPNIKENKGALRDLHLVQWLAKYAYGVKSLKELERTGILSTREYREWLYAQRFLWTVRIHLHLGAGRAQERLMFDEQKRIGALLGYRTHNAYKPVERFMKRYFQVAKTIGHTIRTLCAAMETDHMSVSTFSLSSFRTRFISLPGYKTEGHYLRFDDDVDIASAPYLMIEVFLAAHDNRLSVHPRTLA